MKNWKKNMTKIINKLLLSTLSTISVLTIGLSSANAMNNCTQQMSQCDIGNDVTTIRNAIENQERRMALIENQERRIAKIENQERRIGKIENQERR